MKGQRVVRINTKNLSFRAFFRVFALCLFLSWVSSSQARSATPLSTLTDGDFERQLDLPGNDLLDKHSTLFQDADKLYQKLPFSPGERMRFVVTYLGVSGGTAEILAQPPVKFGNSWAHRFTAEVKSARWYRWIMQIHDSIEALMHSGSEFVPGRFYINQQESSFRQTKIVEFDSTKNVINQRTKRKDREENRASFPFVTGSKDAVGALYFLRARLAATNPPPLELDIPIFTSERTWTGKANYLGSDFRKIGSRKYESDVFQLVTTFGGLMEQRGDIRVWFTRDERRIPLYIEANVRFGFIKVTLDEWDPGEHRKEQFPPLRHNL